MAEQDSAAQDREWLDYSVAELVRLAPEAGEEETLAGRLQSAHARAIELQKHAL